ncbi:hypothetical protein A3Q56_04870, partial [Intoshia linei]
HDIEKYFKSGMNQSEISRKTGVCRSSVQNVLKKFKNGDGIERKVGAGLTYNLINRANPMAAMYSTYPHTNSMIAAAA